jgi:hypothetical protein
MQAIILKPTDLSADTSECPREFQFAWLSYVCAAQEKNPDGIKIGRALAECKVIALDYGIDIFPDFQAQK